MKNTLTQTLEIPVSYTPDVLVVGGGFAGIAAALSAARMGKKVMLENPCARTGFCLDFFCDSIVK